MVNNLILSDFHGRNPVNLVRAKIESGNIQNVAFLGDYDNPRVLADILNLRLEYPTVQMKIVVGNHDYHFARGQGIRSSLLEFSSREYIKLWEKESDKTIQKVLCPSSMVRGGESLAGRAISYSHAGLSGRVEDKRMHPNLWARYFFKEGLLDEESIYNGFDSMNAQGVDIKFRGHDHLGGIFSQEKQNPRRNFDISLEREVYLPHTKRHIVNVPAFYHGDFVIFDETQSVVRFEQI